MTPAPTPAPTPDTPAVQARRFDAAVATIALARSFAGARAREVLVVHPERVADVELAVSELATNAVCHGSGEHYEVEVASDPGRLEVRVTSTGARNFGHALSPRPPRPPRPTTDDVNIGVDVPAKEVPQPRGRGLAIVAAVADQVRIEHGRSDASTVVRCAFADAPPRSGA